MKSRGRVKIEIEFIENKPKRRKTFGKRRIGVINKAKQLAKLTGTQVLLLVASETGQVYEYATDKLQPMFTSEAGKALIQSCLDLPQNLTPPPHIDNEPTDVGTVAATGFEKKMDIIYQVLPELGTLGSTNDEIKQQLLSFNNMTNLPGSTTSSSVSAQSIMQHTTSTGLPSQALMSSLPMNGHMMYPSPPYTVMYNVSHGPYDFKVSHEELMEFALGICAADPSLSIDPVQ